MKVKVINLLRKNAKANEVQIFVFKALKSNVILSKKDKIARYYHETYLLRSCLYKMRGHVQGNEDAVAKME